MANQNAKGLKRIINAFGYSMSGFKACYEHEEAFRQEVIAGVVLIPLGFWLGHGGVEKSLLVGSWLVVLIVELLNSAIEANVDRVSMERHELSGRAKDIASAAVFLSIFTSALVWALILIPRYL